MKVSKSFSFTKATESFQHLYCTFDSSNGGHTNIINDLVSLDENLLASASDDHSIKIWQLNEKKLKFTFNSTNGGHNRKVNYLASLNSSYLVSGSAQETSIKIWDFNLGQLSKSYEHSKNVKDLVVSDSKTLIASGSSQEIIVWDVLKKMVKFNFSKKKDFHSDASTLRLTFINASLLASAVEDEIKIWNLPNERLESTFNFKSYKISSFLSVSDNTNLAFGLNDGRIQIFNFIKNKTHSRYKEHSKAVRHLLKSSDYLISGSNDNNIILSSLYTNSVKYVFDSSKSGHNGSITSLVLLDRYLLASGSDDKTIKIWNLTNGEIKFTFDSINQNGHTDKVTILALIKNQKFLASGSKDMKIKIWNNFN